MNRDFVFLLFSLFVILSVSCHQEQTIHVEVDFQTKLLDDNFTSPVTVTIINQTKNADEFYWTFEGGEPSNSNKKNPGSVVFTSPGEHTITLEAWNPGDRNAKTSVIRVDSTVVIDFSVEAEINNYAPAEFYVNNLSSGGNNYRWIFEGGEPSVYEGFAPPVVTYKEEGTYAILLIVNNGSEDFILSKNIEVRESLDAAFTIVPSFEDIDDMEAPLRATLDTWLKGVETLLWECDNAVINNETSPDANIFFSEAGNYTVYLNASNGKQDMRISQNITVLPNTNLRTHSDIKFGINSAQNTIGTVYSTRLRRGFTGDEISKSNGYLIDIAFLGLNSNFIYNKFVSPDNLFDTPLIPIPDATSTRFINLQEKNEVIQLTVEQFKTMTTDVYLKNMDLKSVNPEIDFFRETPLPRVVLFETADKRKGAILVKEIVKAGMENSYILTDIKIQKND